MNKVFKASSMYEVWLGKERRHWRQSLYNRLRAVERDRMVSTYRVKESSIDTVYKVSCTCLTFAYSKTLPAFVGRNWHFVIATGGREDGARVVWPARKSCATYDWHRHNQLSVWAKKAKVGGMHGIESSGPYKLVSCLVHSIDHASYLGLAFSYSFAI